MVTGFAVPTGLPCLEKRVPRELAAGRWMQCRACWCQAVDMGCLASSWVPQQPGRGLRGAAQCGGVFYFRPVHLCALHGCELSLGPEGEREGPPPGWPVCALTLCPLEPRVFSTCCCSVQLRPALGNPVDCITPDSPFLHCLLEFAQAHIH